MDTLKVPGSKFVILKQTRSLGPKTFVKLISVMYNHHLFANNIFF